MRTLPIRSGPICSVLVVAAVLTLGGCSSSGSSAPASSGSGTPTPAPSPSLSADLLPTIPEAFTLLPCPSPANTTLAMEGCAEHRIVALDRQITATAREVYAGLSPAGQRQLLVGQVAWIAARHAACTKAANVYAGGTLAPVAFANCEVHLDRLRLARLAALGGGNTSP